MSVRLSELAKQLGTTKKELFEKLPALGFEIRKSAVDIDDSLADEIKDALRKSGAVFAPPVKPERPRKVAKKKTTTTRPKARKPVRKATDVPVEPAVPAEPEAARETPLAAAPPSEEPPAPALPAPAATLPVEPPAPPAPPTPPAPPRAPLRLPYQPPRPVSRDMEGQRLETALGVTGSDRGAPAPAPPALEAPAPSSLRPGGQRLPVPQAGPHPAPGDARRPIPEQPRTTPKAPRPMAPRPVRGRAGRRPQTPGRPGVRGPAATASVSTPPAVQVPLGPLKPVTLSESATVKELCEKLSLKSRDVIKRLMTKGIFATINQPLDREVAIQVSREFGYEARVVSFEEESVLDEVAAETEADLLARPPVVTVMGHVDHGKTTLLDAIRETNVAAREAGQITQHIGAYQVETKGRSITFLDTPGHEAFTMMRARGARVTDVVVLVVAADDGVMPQTIEAIHHAKAAGVPIVVAVNKMDLPTANPDRVLQALADRGLLVEQFGGETVMVRISAKKRTGLDELLDLILLVADLQELKANPKRSAAGVVLEAKLDKGRGPVATVLVQAGTLRTGDPFIAGAVYGKVRAMYNDRGDRREDAGPAVPVEVLGLQGVPMAGDAFQVVSEDWKARQIGSFRQAQLRERALAKSARLTLDALYQQIADGHVRELPIVLKGDVQGSVEALTDMLQKLSDDKVKVRIIHSGTGAISETDILLASASNAIVVGFNVRPERKARDLAESERVDLRLHTIVYNVTEEIRAAMQGLLEPTMREAILGRVEVRQLFRIPKIGTVAGCYVQDGRITRDSQIRLLRDNVVIYEGRLASLKRFKEDVTEVRNGYECGLSMTNFHDLKEGDVLEAFKIEQVPQAS